MTLPVASASAQTALDRIVGRDETGELLVITETSGAQFARLAKAAAVPLGFEGLLSGPRPISIAATGSTLRSVLEGITSADPRRDSSVPYLDRIVGNDLNGQPIRAHGVLGQFVTETIAAAAEAPVGMESLPTNETTLLYDDGVNLTGLTLRQALDTLVHMDPRYEWREVNGVPVIRPTRAWNDPENHSFNQCRFRLSRGGQSGAWRTLVVMGRDSASRAA